MEICFQDLQTHVPFFDPFPRCGTMYANRAVTISTNFHQFIEINSLQDGSHEMFLKNQFLKTNGKQKQSVLEDIKSMTQNQVPCIHADKTNNLYQLSMKYHSKLPTENNSKNYNQKRLLIKKLGSLHKISTLIVE